ncbi:hypothetical protein EV361DRAFT_353297 [Lentinula raphanica]|nr:hypothetical protein F5880DRAFT_441172 [Lentinula raphanica]KAJ3969395.1 hypothetical protein EV361DRAFT_353297 [Lentinula raphanica]
MSFAFVPRNVGKKTQKTQVSNSTARNSNFVDSKGKGVATNTFPHTPPVPSTTASLTSHTDEGSVLVEEISTLLALSLTEYALWANGDMRRRIEQTTEDENGFVPLSYILKHSPLVPKSQLQSLSETAIVKALRKHAGNHVEVRMLLSGPTWSNFGPSSTSTDEGMYEIRPRTRMLEGVEVTYTRDYWAKRTVYIENIPLHHRTTHGIFHLIRNLSSSSDSFKIQSISFPPHHLDLEIDPSDPQSSRSSSSSKCKGFAFVVFSTLEDVDRFCTTWDWKRPQSKAGVETDSSFASASDTPSNAELAVSEARKHGFRALPKIRWDQLKEEYLAWQRQLREQVLAEQDRQKEELASQMKEELGDEELHLKESKVDSNSTSSSAALPSSQLSSSSSSSYPQNCLVFVRNVHPGTNKTTLRSLFSKALASGGLQKSSQPQDQNIDYVDYTKGMDTCYVRFSSPSHAPALQKHFLRHRIVQEMPLDDNGVDLTIGAEKAGASKHIEVEVIQGKKEEIYWEKVPMKVRQEAVRKALSISNATSSRSEPPATSSDSFYSASLSKTNAPVLHPTSASSTQFSSHTPPYPSNCLVFIRNIHPGTNKTTLRAFFANILSRRSKSGDTDNSRDFDIRSAIDYVDYTKGTDCCHLRLASSSNALALVERLKENPVIQETPLDDGGGVTTDRSDSDAASSPRYVAAELVQGTRERFYWEKVPLKVRQEAARKANCAHETPFASALNDHSLEALSERTYKKLKKRDRGCTTINKDDSDVDNGQLLDEAGGADARKRRRKI